MTSKDPSPLDERPSEDSPRPAYPIPSMVQTVIVLVTSDLKAIARSWLVRGFLLVSVSVSLLTLKGMQADQAPASQMLESLYVTYLLIWMHGVIFISGSALIREQECLGDAILSRGICRSEYIVAKLLARGLTILFLIAGVLVPSSFWALRQDRLVRTETGFLSANAQSVEVEAWEPQKVFAAVDGPLLSLDVEVGDEVQAGEVLALIDDRILHDTLETERRAEKNARNQVENHQRQFENSRRAVSQAEEAMTRAERALIAKDLMSQLEQSDREADLRTRKRELKDAENAMRQARDSIATSERAVADAQSKVLLTRKRLSDATVTAPISGYVTEVLVQASATIGIGTHLLTIAPHDDYQLRVPIYNFNEFKRLKEGIESFITVQGTEFRGRIDRIGAMTEEDRWGQKSNYVIVRFQGDGTLGLLGVSADVRMVLPPPEKEALSPGEKLMNALTGHGEDDLETRTASVTTPWILIGCGKILASAILLVSLSIFLAVLCRNALISILGTTGLWHISNLIFDFSGLRELSYLEMVRTMDKVLGGITHLGDELQTIAWLLGISLVFMVTTIMLFAHRDPQK